MERIYLDYAAGTPVDPAVMKAIEPYFSGLFGNPGSVHSFGQQAIAAIDRSREALAGQIGAGFREIIFTSSATEANNLALRGAVAAFRKKSTTSSAPRIIVSSVEHESVLETARDLAREGVDVRYTPVDAAGVVQLKNIKEIIDGNTALVSVMYAQNEIGAREPVPEIAHMVQEWRANNKSNFPLMHTDAAQAFQFLDCNTKALGVDLMTISSHKIYGPKGAGALYIKSGVTLESEIAGGGQEFDIRSGTENVPAIVGFAKAAEHIAASRDEENKRIASLAEVLWAGIKKIYPEAVLNGSNQRLPNILNIYFPGHLAQELLTQWDLNGLAASSGSACRSRAIAPSYVIEAMGYSKERAVSSIRVSLGRPTTAEDIKGALKIMSLFSKESRTI